MSQSELQTTHVWNTTSEKVHKLSELQTTHVWNTTSEKVHKRTEYLSFDCVGTVKFCMRQPEPQD